MLHVLNAMQIKLIIFCEIIDIILIILLVKWVSQIRPFERLGEEIQVWEKDSIKRCI